MDKTRAVQRLQKALQCLPGVGPKSAQRMTFHLLENNRDGAHELTRTLAAALEGVVHCARCNNFSESELCEICTSSSREAGKLCVVETPADLQTVEQSGAYNGLYFVLMGRMSPLDGIGPQQLPLQRLTALCQQTAVKEIILATNQTTEGEATADYIGDLASSLDVRVTRLARGLPVGAELEYTDAGTLMRAFSERREVPPPQ